MSPGERLLRAVVVAACTYEVAAICTGRVPTITELNRRHPEVGSTLLAALAWHFRPDPKEI